MERTNKNYEDATNITNVVYYFFLIKGIIVFIISMAIKSNQGIIYGFWCFCLAIIMKLFLLEIGISFIIDKLLEEEK